MMLNGAMFRICIIHAVHDTLNECWRDRYAIKMHEASKLPVSLTVTRHSLQSLASAWKRRCVGALVMYAWLCMTESVCCVRENVYLCWYPSWKARSHLVVCYDVNT